MTKNAKAIIVIVAGAICGGLGAAALVFPDQAIVLATVSGSLATLIGVITGIQILRG